ncbi:hypothetical protein PT974_08999 [Cladobotryum mycophilum]|uniref:DNL-type domain-containing protein n=1 Tax=Cladobotryum mycophilum TaxID=491253 RepID=A0ABR0SF34_9HYPO
MASKAAPLISPLMRRTFQQSLRASSFQTTLRRSHLHPIYIPAISSTFTRAAHTIPRPPKPSTRRDPNKDPYLPETETETEAKSESERPESKGPAYYQLSFTCIPCSHRSHHNVSKQGYHHGSTLITCPSCRNRHVISDHLNIFGDRKITIEDLMREKGQLVKRGSLGEDGDIEFWPDDTLPEESESTNKKESS